MANSFPCPCVIGFLVKISQMPDTSPVQGHNNRVVSALSDSPLSLTPSLPLAVSLFVMITARLRQGHCVEGSEETQLLLFEIVLGKWVCLWSSNEVLAMAQCAQKCC